jgi:uncharacterized protein (DUF885 family)
VGERRLTALRAAAAAAVGDGSTCSDFHDEVLRHGALPLDLLGDLVARRFGLAAAV